jgi:hypothetical protein
MRRVGVVVDPIPGGDMTVSFDRESAGRSAEVLRKERVGLASRQPAVVGRGWAPAEVAMAAAVDTEPTDIAGVLERLTTVQEILDILPPTPALNRVAAFNSLYYTITDRVAQALHGPGVTDPDFLEMLDVEFAKRYFTALRLWGLDDDATPDAWEVLFRRGIDQRVSRLAAAMLGVNAHINYDLAFALIETWKKLGPPGDEMHPDYLLINKIFYEEIPVLRRRYSTPWQLDLDRICLDLDDWSQELLVYSTRAYAWDKAIRIWPLCSDQEDFAHAQLVLDRATALLGESLILGDGVVNRMGSLATAVWHLVRSVLTGILGVAGPKDDARTV